MKQSLKILILNIFLFSSIIAQISPPTNLTAQSVKFDFEGMSKILVRLDWDGVTDANSDPVPLYNIYRKDGAQSSSNEYVSLGSVLWNTTFMDNSVVVGSTYTYYVTAMKDVESEPSNIVEVTVQENPIGIASSTITGTVRDEVSLAPLPGVYVTLISKSNFTANSVLTDADGNYSIQVIPGDYIVYFKAMQDYFPEFYDNVRHVWEATELTFETDMTYNNINADLAPISLGNLFTLSGNVKDMDGNPVDAMVDIMKIGRNGHPVHHNEVQTDSEGNFIANVLEGSQVAVFAYPTNSSLAGEFFDNSYSLANAVKFDITQNVENVNFILEPKIEGNSSISGNVHNANGDPVESMVIAVKLGMNRYDKENNLKAIVDESGNYSFEHLTVGDYILFVVPAEGYIPTFYKEDGSLTFRWKDADILTLGDNTNLTDIDFQLVELPAVPDNGLAELGGSVLDNGGQPLQDVNVFVFNQSNELVSFSTSNDMGNYTVSGLAPGKYSVVADNYAYSESEKTDVYVGYDQQASVNFSLSPETPLSVGENSIVNEYKLSQNYPNPFNPSTLINFSIAEKSNVKLAIYNVLGKEIALLVKDELNPGEYKFQFNAQNLPSGIYFYELSTDKFKDTKKMILLK